MDNFDNFWQLFVVVTLVIYHFTFPIMHPVYPPSPRPPQKIKCMIVVSNFSFVLKVVPKEIEDIIIIVIVIIIIIITFIYKRVKTSGKCTIS